MFGLFSECYRLRVRRFTDGNEFTDAQAMRIREMGLFRLFGRGFWLLKLTDAHCTLGGPVSA